MHFPAPWSYPKPCSRLCIKAIATEICGGYMANSTPTSCFQFSYLYSTIVCLANQGKFFIIFFSSAGAALEVFLPSLYLSDQCQKTHEIEAKNATAAMSSSYLPSKASETKMGNSKWMKGKLWLFDSFWSRFYRFRACFLRGSHLTAKVKNSHWKNRYEIIHIQYRSHTVPKLQILFKKIHLKMKHFWYFY